MQDYNSVCSSCDLCQPGCPKFDFLYFDLCGLEKEIKPAVNLSIAALMLDALMMQI